MILKAIKILVFIALLLVLVGAVANVAVAQSEGVTVDANETVEVEEPTEYEFIISDSSRVISTEWDGKTYIMRLEADKTGDITISDAGKTARKGENVEYRVESYTVSREGITTIRFTVDEQRQVAHSMDGTHWLNGYDDSIRGWVSDQYSQEALIIGIGWTFFLILANWAWLRIVVRNRIKRLD